MAFVQFKLDKSVEQTRGIFDKYIYCPDNADTVADILASGYFDLARFASEGDWINSIIEIKAIDGYAIALVVEGGTVALYDSTQGGVVNVNWGDIMGDINAQADLQVQFESKLNTEVSGILSLVQGEAYVGAVQALSASAYTFSTDNTATDPGVGGIKVNDNDDFTQVTQVYISETTLLGRSISPILSQVVVGDIVRLGQANSANYFTGEVTAPPIDNGTWWTVSVSSVASSGGINQPLTVSLDLFEVGKRGAFGDGHQAEIDNSVSTTNSSNYQNKLTLITGDLPLGKYKISAMCEITSDDDRNEAQVRLMNNGSVLVESGIVITKDGEDRYNPWSMFDVVQISGVNTIELDWREQMGGVASIRRARIEIFRVS